MQLKPAFYPGSGFHRHVFGDTDDMQERPRHDWQHLVGQVAAAIQVAIPDGAAMLPVHRWDALVLRGRPKMIFVIMAGAQPLPLTWVADFLYRPLVIAGVVMSDQESGL